MLIVTNSPAASDLYDPGVDIEREVLGVDVDEGSILRRGILRGIRDMFRLAIRTRRVVARRDVTSVLSFLTTANLLTIIACLGTGTFVVVSERNDTSRQSHPFPVRIARHLLYRFADVVTANSPAAIQDMRRYVPSKKLRFVPNSVVVPSTCARPDQSRQIVSVGRLVAHKDHQVLIDAFASIDDPSWRLTIVGDGPMRDTLRSQAQQAGCTDRVTLLGYLYDPGTELAKSAIFVLPSQYEGMPNALLEAMAHGVPCIVSNTLKGALATVADEALVTFRAGDSEDLARALRLLITDPTRRVLYGRIARERVRELSPERVAELWDGILAGPPRP